MIAINIDVEIHFSSVFSELKKEKFSTNFDVGTKTFKKATTSRQLANIKNGFTQNTFFGMEKASHKKCIAALSVLSSLGLASFFWAVHSWIQLTKCKKARVFGHNAPPLVGFGTMQLNTVDYHWMKRSGVQFNRKFKFKPKSTIFFYPTFYHSHAHFRS